MNEMDERNARIVEMREAGVTFRAIGEAVGITTERVRQIWMRHERHRKRREAMEAREDYQAAVAAKASGSPIPGHVGLDAIAYMIGFPEHHRVVMHLRSPGRYSHWRPAVDSLPPIKTVADFRRVSPVSIARRYPNIGIKCLLPFLAALDMPVPHGWSHLEPSNATG